MTRIGVNYWTRKLLQPKKDLKLTETEEINHLVLLEEVEKRLTSKVLTCSQQNNFDCQIGAEIRSRDDMMSMVTAEVDAVAKLFIGENVNDFFRPHQHHPRPLTLPFIELVPS